MNITKGFYKIRDIQPLLIESKNEAKPVLGKGVASSNKKNNSEAVSNMLTDSEKTVKSARHKDNEQKQNIDSDLNRTLLDLNYAYDPGEGYKERVKSQVHGYPSVENEKSHKGDDSTDYEGNKKFYKSQSEKSKYLSDKRTKIAHAGLKSHNLPKEEFEPHKVFNESKKMKRLLFKNTKFLSEAQMLNKIPEDYCYAGSKFIMQDADGLEYMIECVVDPVFKTTKINIVNKMNRNQLCEQFKRMKELYNYNSGDYTHQTHDNSDMGTILNTVRDIMR